MIEEINFMINSEEFKMRSKLKKTLILSSNNLLLSSKYIPGDEEIVLPEETYHYANSENSDVSIIIDKN